MQIGDLFQFDRFIAPMLIKIVYWIGLVFIVLGTLAYMFGMSMMSSYGYGGGGAGVGTILFGLIGGAAWVLIWRILCEVWIVIFSINDRLGIIAERDR